MNVGIIGCGASGMMAAITAARLGHSVTILEKNNKPGKKLLATGNGKCNYTNANITPDFYNSNAKELFEAVYGRFNKKDTIDFFEKTGITSYEKNGYIYPRSEQAQSVVKCLDAELIRQNVNVIYDCNISKVVKNNQFEVYADAKHYVFDRLIIAAGSNASPKSGSDGSGYGLAIKLGHNVIKPLPALCGLKCDGADFKAISGVRCQATVTLLCDGQFVKKDTGELQITEYGISGIPVFQISANALRLKDEGHNVSVIVDYASEYRSKELFNYLKERIGSTGKNFLEGFINSKLAEMIYEQANINKESEISIDDNTLNYIVDIIKNSEYKVTGHRGFENCQVCSGGIDINEIDDSLESKIVKGLYFAGEIIDINGDCGGYNLQWAWSSGYVAGRLSEK